MESIIMKLSCTGKCYLGYDRMEHKCLTQCACCIVEIYTKNS